MAVKHIDLDDCYNAKTEDKDIVVDVTIGDGQEGSYSIFFANQFIEANAPATIGKKDEVTGKRTTVSVTVVDELQETNWTSMTVWVQEGNHQTKYGPYSAQAENHLDTVIYTLKLWHQ